MGWGGFNVWVLSALAIDSMPSATAVMDGILAVHHGPSAGAQAMLSQQVSGGRGGSWWISVGVQLGL